MAEVKCPTRVNIEGRMKGIIEKAATVPRSNPAGGGKEGTRYVDNPAYLALQEGYLALSRERREHILACAACNPTEVHAHQAE